jgi:hypothetical protein
MRPDIDFLAQQQRYKDLIREADRERLARQALAEDEKQTRFYLRILTWLGQQLANLGCSLRRHLHGLSRTTSDLPALNPCMKQE